MGEISFKIILIIFNLIFIAFISGIIIFVREYRKKKKAHEEELETVNLLHKKELLQTQMEIQTQTMKYIGREIHDNVGQKLTLSSLYLQQLVLENKTPEVNESIDSISDIINQSLSDLRQLSKSLTDDTIHDNSLTELIKIECEKIRQLKSYKVIFVSTLTITVTSYRIKSILLRIVQEFMQNSIKHAQCKNINITIVNTKDEVELLLKDDGKGFDINNITSKGIGLKNIEKRVDVLNGNYSLTSDKNGTVLTVKIPINDTPNSHS